MPHWTDRLFTEQADLYTEFLEARFDDAPDEVEDLLALLEREHDADPGSVLDLACGIGRHVVAFADRGLDADGLDFSRPFVEEGRARIDERGLADRATLIEHDLRDLDEVTGSYDLVTSFWNSLGYYGRETDREVLAEARRLLADDGLVAIELGNKDHYLANFEAAVVHEDDNRLTVERREYDVDSGRFHTTLDRFDVADGYEHRDSLEWENRVYAPAVLRELCLAAGFEDVSLYGGLGGRELSLETDTAVAIAR